jgi:hypothetical protein
VHAAALKKREISLSSVEKVRALVERTLKKKTGGKNLFEIEIK